MDVYPEGDILSIGDVNVNGDYTTFSSQYSSEGVLLGESASSRTNGLIRELIAGSPNVKLTDYPSKVVDIIRLNHLVAHRMARTQSSKVFQRLLEQVEHDRIIPALRRTFRQ